MLLHALPLLAILPLSLAKKISVDVGKTGLVFSPDTITAEKGDSIEFTFYPQSHNVVESTFDKPCIYKSGGVFSGTDFKTSNDNPSSKTFTVNIDNSDTRWLYCSVNKHCQQGMSLVINQKDHTLKDYKGASSAAPSSNDPNSVSGGTVSDKSGSSSASSSVTAKATSATSASASSATSASASSASALASSASSSSTAASITSSSNASRASATSASATSTGAASKVGAGAALGIAGMLLGGLI